MPSAAIPSNRFPVRSSAPDNADELDGCRATWSPPHLDPSTTVNVYVRYWNRVGLIDGWMDIRVAQDMPASGSLYWRFHESDYPYDHPGDHLDGDDRVLDSLPTYGYFLVMVPGFDILEISENFTLPE